jgi:hypothetical protein
MGLATGKTSPDRSRGERAGQSLGSDKESLTHGQLPLWGRRGSRRRKNGLSLSSAGIASLHPLPDIVGGQAPGGELITGLA